MHRGKLAKIYNVGDSSCVGRRNIDYFKPTLRVQRSQQAYREETTLSSAKVSLTFTDIVRFASKENESDQ